MRLGRLAVIVGTIMVFFGAVFQFQGRGQIGPESSFMYHSKDWISYGIMIIISGIAVGGFGAFLSKYR